MPTTQTAFLVVCRDDGFGDTYQLLDGTRYTMGRAPTNRIVLQDDLCSREHAEVYREGGAWHLRDFGSLNGSRVNDQPVSGTKKLNPRDYIRVGRTQFLFVNDLTQLPELSAATGAPTNSPSGEISISKRCDNTRYLPAPEPPAAEETTRQDSQISPNQTLSVLYRLALDMADAATVVELCELTVDAAFRITLAEVAAVLALQEGGELEPLVYRHRGVVAQTYHKVSRFVSREVLSSKQAILAAHVAANRELKNRDSITELKVASLICAPVLFEDQILGLLHLYRIVQHPPLNPDDLEVALAVARQLGRAWQRLRKDAKRTTLSAEVRSLKDQLKLESELIGGSPALERVETQIRRVSETKATVLVRGESGVGKELVARAIHNNSPRKDAAFVTLNCAALPQTLLENELFGHEKGSFTGATDRLIGKFEAADNGTIFLDEIGEMALTTQAKFLRVLEGHPFERIGGNTSIRVDVRVIAATNRSLEEAIRAGTFRRDLFFRLQVVEIVVPPLRNRVDDVPLIAEHFRRRFVRETGRKIRGFSDAAVAKLKNYGWPGNVRELRNVIERAVALGTGPEIEAADIWLSSVEVTAPPPSRPGAELISLDDVEKRHIRAVLSAVEGNKSRAAAVLGIERSTLERKMKGYAPDPPHSGATGPAPTVGGPGEPADGAGASHGFGVTPETTANTPAAAPGVQGAIPPAPDAAGSREDDGVQSEREQLRAWERSLHDHQWKTGKTSTDLFGNRQGLPRRVQRLFKLHPALRREFPEMSKAFPPQVTGHPG